jgi:hypothetical protein
MVDRDGEGRPVVVRVVGDHRLQLQATAVGLGHGHANQPLGVRGHEVHVGLCGELGGTNQVALVLAVRVVDDDNNVARAQFVEGRSD